MSRNTESNVFLALGHPTRRAVLNYLRDQDYKKVADISEAVGVSGSTLSAHLRTLRDAELVISRRSGTEIQYRVNLTIIDDVMLFLASLRRKP
ncbi:MAG: ArsR/SmtB family transcription factor [Brevibacterium aurantiacum]